MSFAQNALQEYKEGGFKHIKGWLGEKIPDLLDIVCEFHESNSVVGDVLEIGVFQGKLFLALVAATRHNETAVAVDLFDDQSLSVDNHTYGGGLHSILLSNIEEYAAVKSGIRVITADSMTFRSSTALGISSHGGYRIISVDGGHTAEHVMNDLAIAADIIVGGGVVLLDDWMSPHWPGVQEGYNRFMRCSNRNLAPVIFTDNKLLLTTISHAPAMLEHVRKNFAPWPEQSVRDVQSHGFPFIAAA